MPARQGLALLTPDTEPSRLFCLFICARGCSDIHLHIAYGMWVRGWYSSSISSTDESSYKPRHLSLVAEVVSAPTVEVGRRRRPPSTRNTQAPRYVLTLLLYSAVDSCTHVNIAR